MDLRTGRPVWFSSRLPRFRSSVLKKDVSCDVAIIGAGISGALVAHQLVNAGLAVVLLDRREPATGSTAASTGLLMYQTDMPLEELARRHGADASRRVYQLGRRAIRDLRALVTDLDIDCGWCAKRTLYLASRPQDQRLLKKERDRSRRIGLKTTWLNARSLRRSYHLSLPGALHTQGAGEVDAFRLTRGILEFHQRRHALPIYASVTVTRIDETMTGAIVRTRDGRRVRARYVIVAAGDEAGRFVKSDLVRLHSTYVIASAPMPAKSLWPTECLMWETARPYFYLRTTPDHRILFGGADEAFANASRRDRLLPKKRRELEKQFAELFPHLAFKADYAWTGTFAETVDGLPCIGPVRDGSRILCALGYGGNGITFSQIAARILRDICCGRRNTDAELFRPDRKTKST